MKKVTSVSLGSSTRNKSNDIELLGEQFHIERVGTDGDMAKFQATFEELDGKVDALGVGGADIYIYAGSKRFAFRQILNCIKNVKKTPVVDGSGLKHTLEREAIHRLQRDGTVNFNQEKVLLVSAVDRYGMAQALNELCPNIVYGDFLFGLGINYPLRKYSQVEKFGKLIAPIITQLPFKWFYPTGEKQETRSPKFPKVWDESTFICGDSLFILRYAPDRLDGKTILTQSVRKQNLEWFKAAGVNRVITTTPVVGGETFATNVMEGVLLTLMNKPADQVAEADYLAKLAELNWAPTVIELN